MSEAREGEYEITDHFTVMQPQKKVTLNATSTKSLMVQKFHITTTFYSISVDFLFRMLPSQPKTLLFGLTKSLTTSG